MNSFRCPAKLLVVAVLCQGLCGCLSMRTVESARRYEFVDENGEVMEVKKAKPGYYLLLPLTVPVDAVMTASVVGFFVILFGASSGSSSSSTPPPPSGLKVK
jgi:hypothetical protein